MRVSKWNLKSKSTRSQPNDPKFGISCMKISRIKVNNFRRFVDLEIKNIPCSAKLVILSGPNGSGKSSLFDAFLLKYRADNLLSYREDREYYNNNENQDIDFYKRIQILTHGSIQLLAGSFYIRGAHRHEADFQIDSLSKQRDIIQSFNLSRLIDQDAEASMNYQRIAAQTLEDVFVNELPNLTIAEFRERIVGDIRKPILRLFSDLNFLGIGNPLENGTFQFSKGKISKFDYKNLSGGEKAAFDLITDLVIKRRTYKDAIYCIDEPELHMNTRTQGALLEELLELIPDESQLWIASHSIGMLRKARELYDKDPNSVVFLDFGDRDFDQATVIEPTKPTRAFWANVLHVALDDLAFLVAPSEVVICEGNPAGQVPGKNAEHDARVYTTIFADEFPDTTFISAGNSREVSGDFLGIAAALPKIANGMKIKRLIDLDDHTSTDVADFNEKGITVLGRRHLESYLWDDEVLTALCNSLGKSAEIPSVLAEKEQAIADSVSRGNMADDVKKAAGTIHQKIKRILSTGQLGNDPASFARDTLAPLIKPGMSVYDELKTDIFGR